MNPLGRTDIARHREHRLLRLCVLLLHCSRHLFDYLRLPTFVGGDISITLSAYVQNTLGDIVTILVYFSRLRGARIFVVDGEEFVVCHYWDQWFCTLIIHEDVWAENYSWNGHAGVNGEHHRRHGNLVLQSRQISKHCIFVDLSGDVLCRDEAVDRVPGKSLFAQSDFTRELYILWDLLRQHLSDSLPHSLRLVEEKGNLI